MKRWMLLPFVFAGCLIWFAPVARGQTLIERLEGRLNNLLAPPNAGAPQPPAPPGEEPGYLGLVVDDDEDAGGIKVISVRPGSPAEKFGLKPDDVVLKLNGQVVAKVDDMGQMLDRSSPGAKLTFDIRRDGKASRVQVTLASRPGAEAVAPPDRRPFTGPADRPAIGLTVAPLTDEARARFGLTVRRGALITAVAPGGPAHRAGFPIGGVIVAYDGRAIHTAEELIATVRGARVGDEVELSYYDGDQLHRKQVRLGPSVEALDPNVGRRPPVDAPLSLKPRDGVGGGGGGAAIGRLEKMIEGVVRPPGGAPRAEAADNITLRRQVETLQAQIDELQQRIKELEARLPPAKQEKD